MPMFLPVPAPPPDHPDATAEQWETAAGGPSPSVQQKVDGPMLKSGGSVAMYRSGPGDYGTADEWMGEDIFVVGRQGVENGRGLFDQNVWQPPNEGHGEYGFAQDGPKIDHSTRTLALFWSDWISSTAGKGTGGSFTGEHVVINRIPPGSTQGYMPSDPGMAQYNTARNMPGPWDAQLEIGRQQFIQRSLAATSGATTSGVNG